MNSNTKVAVLKAGIIPEQTVSELERWGMDVPEGIQVEPDLDRALDGIREAVESKETVEIRMTHLDGLKVYELGQRMGRLYYVIPDNSSIGVRKTKTTFVKVTYAITPSGDYLIPWTSDDVFDLMLDPGTYLKPAEAPRVRFIDVDSLFYGEQKTFMICRPSTEKDEQEEGHE